MDVPGTSNMSTYAQWSHMVECPICYNLYDKPMQMSCGHTLCSSCIGQLVEQVRRNPDDNAPRVNLAVVEGGALVGNFMDQFEDAEQFLEIPRMDQREFQNMRGMIAIPPRRPPGTTIKCPECRNPTFVPNDGLPVNYRVQELVAKVAPMIKDRHLVKHCSQCEEVLSQGVYFNCTQCTENCTKICSTCIVRSHNGHKIDEIRVLTSKDVREMKAKIESYQQEALQALEEVKPRLADIGGSIESKTMQKLNEFAKVFENMIESFDSKIEEHTTSAELEVEVKKAADISDLFKGSLKRLNDGLFTAINDAVSKFWDPFEYDLQKMRVQIGFVPKPEVATAEPAQAAQNARAQEDIAAGEAVAVAAAHAVLQPINRRQNEAGVRNRNAQQAAAHFGNVQRQRQRRQFPGPPMQQIFQHMMINMPQQQPHNQMQVMRGPPPPQQARPIQQVMHHHHHAMPPQMQPGMPHQQMQQMNMFPQMQQQQQQQQQQMHPRAPQQMMGPVINAQQQFQNMHIPPQRQMHPHPQMMQQPHPQQAMHPQQQMHMHMGGPQNQQMQMPRHPHDPRDFGAQHQQPQPQRMNVVQRMHPQFAHQQAHEQQVQMQQMQQVPMQQGQPAHQQQVALRAQQPPVDIPQGPWDQQMPPPNQEQPPQFPFNDGEIAEVHEAAEAEQEEAEEPVQRLNPEIDAFRVANANMQEYHDMRDRLQADAIVIEDVNLADELQPMNAENAAIQMAPDMIGGQEGFAHFQEMRQEVDAIGVDEFNNGEPGDDIQEEQQGFIELYENPQVDEEVAEEADNAPQEAEVIEEHPVIVLDDQEEEQDVVAQQADRNPPRRSARRDNSIEVSPELRRSTRHSARNAAHQEEASTSSGTSDTPRSPSPVNVPKRRKVDRKPIVEEPEDMDESNDTPAETNRPAKRRATTSTSQSAASSSSNGAPATRRNPRS